MKIAIMCAASISLLALSSCSHESKIERVRDVPIKSVAIPAFETGLHRAQITYVMRGALTHEEMEARLGEYYYVTWYDAHPELPAQLVMRCQTGETGATVHTKTINMPAPRKSGGSQKTVFSFIGDEYKKLGSLLTWRVDLKVNGKIVSTKRSFLWRDDETIKDWSNY